MSSVAGCIFNALEAGPFIMCIRCRVSSGDGCKIQEEMANPLTMLNMCSSIPQGCLGCVKHREIPITNKICPFDCHVQLKMMRAALLQLQSKHTWIGVHYTFFFLAQLLPDRLLYTLAECQTISVEQADNQQIFSLCVPAHVYQNKGVSSG